MYKVKINWLYQFCRLNKDIEVANILGTTPEVIDLRYNEGIYFQFAIKKNNINMVKSLLDYYKKTTGMKYNRDTDEYKEALKDLKKILQEAIRSFEISLEMEKVLGEYFNFKDDDENEQDLGNLDLEEDFSDPEDDIHNIHKSSSAPELLSHHRLNKGLLHSSSESLVSNPVSYEEEMHNFDLTNLLGQDFSNHDG